MENEHYVPILHSVISTERGLIFDKSPADMKIGDVAIISPDTRDSSLHNTFIMRVYSGYINLNIPSATWTNYAPAFKVHILKTKILTLHLFTGEIDPNND